MAIAPEPRSASPIRTTSDHEKPKGLVQPSRTEKVSRDVSPPVSPISARRRHAYDPVPRNVTLDTLLVDLSAALYEDLSLVLSKDGAWRQLLHTEGQVTRKMEMDASSYMEGFEHKPGKKALDILSEKGWTLQRLRDSFHQLGFMDCLDLLERVLGAEETTHINNGISVKSVGPVSASGLSINSQQSFDSEGCGLPSRWGRYGAEKDYFSSCPMIGGGNGERNESRSATTDNAAVQLVRPVSGPFDVANYPVIPVFGPFAVANYPVIPVSGPFAVANYPVIPVSGPFAVANYPVIPVSGPFAVANYPVIPVSGPFAVANYPVIPVSGPFAVANYPGAEETIHINNGFSVESLNAGPVTASSLSINSQQSVDSEVLRTETDSFSSDQMFGGGDGERIESRSATTDNAAAQQVRAVSGPFDVANDPEEKTPGESFWPNFETLSLKDKEEEAVDWAGLIQWNVHQESRSRSATTDNAAVQLVRAVSRPFDVANDPEEEASGEPLLPNFEMLMENLEEEAVDSGQDQAGLIQCDVHQESGAGMCKLLLPKSSIPLTQSSFVQPHCSDDAYLNVAD